MVLQGFHPFDTVQQVPGKAGDCFGNDHVDLSIHAVFHQLLEALPVIRVCSGETVVHVCADIRPVGSAFDLFLVHLDLHGNGKRLIQIVR